MNKLLIAVLIVVIVLAAMLVFIRGENKKPTSLNASMVNHTIVNNTTVNRPNNIPAVNTPPKQLQPVLTVPPIVKNTTVAPPTINNTPIIAPVTLPSTPVKKVAVPDTISTNWNNYCSQMSGGDADNCRAVSQETQIDTLMGIMNGTRSSSILSTGVATWMLSFYPQQLYEAFGCENITALFRPAHFSWLTYVPDTVLAPDTNNSSQFYWLNLTANAQEPYTYNDSGNNSWNCTWFAIPYAPFVEHPMIGCSSAAEADWNSWCNETQVDCGTPDLQMKIRIENILANQSQSFQYKCKHGN